MRFSRFHLSFLFLLLPVFLFSQGKQANNWYFGENAGISFQFSQPYALTNGALDTREGCASISNSEGQLQFYTDGSYVYNRNHVQMLNGYGLNGNSSSTQSAIIVPRPGSTTEYYIFTVSAVESDLEDGLCYTKVDMDLDNGMGDVVSGEKDIQLVPYSCEKVTAIGHSDGESFWVITKIFGNSDFHSYLVSSAGVQPDPVISTTGPSVIWPVGYLKVSPDANWLVSANCQHSVDFHTFDNSTGIVTYVVSDLRSADYYGVEFSPNCTYLYVSDLAGKDIFQYNLSSGDPTTILNSKVSLTIDLPNNYQPAGLQLGPDNRIYIASEYWDYLSRINEPNLPGDLCDLEEDAVYLAGRTCKLGLPPFIQSFFLPLGFTTSQHCSGEPTHFSIVNPAGIDSVKWEFNDAGNYPFDTSTLLNPDYQFSQSGTFYVKLTAWSETGPRIAIDTVIIMQSPAPDIGPDTLVCPDAIIIITLDASPGEQYYWNSDFSQGQPPTYQVTDTGYYRVKVKVNGCSGYDTIHVGRYIEPQLVNAGQSNPAHCGAADGSITGIVLDTGYPFNAVWRDGLGNEVGNSIELINVPSGVYNLEITYGDDCMVPFGSYSIQDIGGPEVANAIPEEDHCNQAQGSIVITPVIGNPADYWYSLNGGAFVQNGGVFTGLAEGNYTVMIRDQFDCTGSYPNNPVAVVNIPGPDISNIIIIDETGGNGSGSITVYANGSNLTYSLNSGPVQAGNSFSNLSSGDYLITIIDEFGCPKDTTVQVQNLQGNQLVAMAGDDKKCLNALANSGIRVSHINGVKDFIATLNYDGSRLRCIHFNDSLQGITGMVYPALAQIVLEWHGTTPITNNDTITLGELIFETLQSGFADVNWQSPPGTIFTDENGNVIDPQFYTGIIEVHQVPDVSLDTVPLFCEGDIINLIPTISGGTDPVIWQWSTPQGTNTNDNILIENALPEHTGKYSFAVNDYFHCADTVSVDITVVPTPKANFPEVNDTIWYEQTFRLEATQGYYSYEWSTGDSIWFINVDKEGVYSVQLKTEEGCQNLESVMMMDAYVPIQVPNAFTPNGDGLNETFSPIVDVELVRRFNIAIYNRWGQRIFETTDADTAWDGEDAMPGVYSWVISYENRVGKSFQMKGSVTLIK